MSTWKKCITIIGNVEHKGVKDVFVYRYEYDINILKHIHEKKLTAKGRIHKRDDITFSELRMVVEHNYNAHCYDMIDEPPRLGLMNNDILAYLI